jgi:hypothetical protein
MSSLSHYHSLYTPDEQFPSRFEYLKHHQKIPDEQRKGKKLNLPLFLLTFLILGVGLVSTIIITNRNSDIRSRAVLEKEPRRTIKKVTGSSVGSPIRYVTGNVTPTSTTGSSGTSGSTGSSGTSGSTGASGTSGSTGASGSSGASGPTGASGANGSSSTTYCQDATIGKQTISVGESVSLTSTANVPVKIFYFALSNLDNLDNETPKPVCVVSGGDTDVFTDGCPAGLHQLVFKVTPGNAVTTANKTFNYSDLIVEDKNIGGGLLTRIMFTDYFETTDGQIIPDDMSCKLYILEESMKMQVKFQGISTRSPKATVRFIFTPTGSTNGVTKELQMTSDDEGIYTGVINGLDPGNYSLSVKGFKHLQLIFSGLVLNSDQVKYGSIDLSQYELPAGDIVCRNPCSSPNWGDNNINALDLGELISEYQKTGTGLTADLNLDGVVNALDLSLVLENYWMEGN